MSVSVIGAGPCGMAAARALVIEGFKVTVFEKQSQFGGAWVYTGKGPMSENLHTNLMHDLMSFKDHEFPKGTPEFCHRQVVWDYVSNYSQEVNADVRFGIEITQVSKKGAQWVLKDHNGDEYRSDFTVVASGHLRSPRYPPLEGLDLNDPRITHSRHFTSAKGFQDKKVLVVGNASSGIDVAVQSLEYTDQVTVSRRSEGFLDGVIEPYVTLKPEIKEITKTGVIFTDDTTQSPDIIMFCTGYLWEFPFLNKYNESLKYPLLHPRRERLCNLYKGMFYIGDPNIAFVAMDKNIVPMPLSEDQAASIARVWNKRLDLPSEQKMLDLEHERVAKKGDSSNYHNRQTPEDVEYMAGLNDWVAKAGPGGFTGERWSDYKVDRRKTVAKYKARDTQERLDKIRSNL